MSRREYETTHPWIRFALDLRRLSHEDWLLLGEARSKCDHLTWVPLRPDTARELHQLFLAKGVHATTAIEGNTLNEYDVREYLEGRLKLPPSKDYLAQEIDNIIQACTEITNVQISYGRTPLGFKTLRDYNKLVLRKLELDEGVAAGEIPAYPVGVARYRGAPRSDCKYLLERMCTWLESEDFATEQLGIAGALIKAIVAHIYFAWIHPFGDGNGRTARLLEFHILIAAGVPTPAAHLLSNHYNETRTEYYRQLDQASKSGGDLGPFLSYAIRGFVDGLQAQLKLVREQQWDVAWRNYVDELFKGSRGTAPDRQRRLLLELSQRAEWTDISEIENLSPEIARQYASKTAKTISRDINALIGRQLLERREKQIRARKELILSFLPPRVQP